MKKKFLDQNGTSLNKGDIVYDAHDSQRIHLRILDYFDIQKYADDSTMYRLHVIKSDGSEMVIRSDRVIKL